MLTPKEIQEQKEKEELEKTQLSQQVVKLTTELNQIKTAQAEEKAEKEEAAEKERLLLLEGKSDIKALLKADQTSEKKGDLEDLTNRELIEVIVEATQEALTSQSTLVEDRLSKDMKQFGQAIVGVQKAVGQIQATMSVSDARGQFSDFDKLKPEILKVMQKYNGNISPEDAYRIVKSQQIEAVPGAHETETERGIDTPFGETGARGQETVDNQGKKLAGKAGFRAIVDRGLETVLSKRYS